MIKFATMIAIALCLATTQAHSQQGPLFDVPVDCALGVDCYVQQYADLGPGNEIRDPFCEVATYDGHKGTDFRVATLLEPVNVVAAAPGIVSAVRDGVADAMVRTAQDRQAIENIECGNGVVITHADGWQTQYCHLKRGSVSVTQGQNVNVGAVLGQTGASGDAAFPHVHFSVRHNDNEIDPFTAKPLQDAGTDCASREDLSASLWSVEARKMLNAPAWALLASGLTNGAIDHDTLADMPPSAAEKTDTALVGWAWLINLQKGDQISLSVTSPDGQLFSETQTQPLNANKADYSLFAGRRRAPLPGDYKIDISVMRDGKEVLSETRMHTIDDN